MLIYLDSEFIAFNSSLCAHHASLIAAQLGERSGFNTAKRMPCDLDARFDITTAIVFYIQLFAAKGSKAIQ